VSEPLPMDPVNGAGPTEADEVTVLESLGYRLDDDGVFRDVEPPLVFAATPARLAANRMLNAARADLGLTGRPNRITRDYASRHGDEFLDAAWCDQSITFWARRSGNEKAVLPHGDRAFTVWHAQDGHDLDLWHSGTAANLRDAAQPGAIVFYDWGLSDDIQAIDHVGVIEHVLTDGRIVAIEGNTANSVKRRVRAPVVVAGFWNPPYSANPIKPKPEPTWTEALVDDLPLLKKGAKGNDVKTLFYLLAARGFGLDPKKIDDTVFGDDLLKQVKAFQSAKKLKADGEVFRQTWTALVRP
jgi:hypothetical protein